MYLVCFFKIPYCIYDQLNFLSDALYKYMPVVI